MRKAIAIDFDGVIHKYSKGWQDGTIYDEPFEGWDSAIYNIQNAGYSVFIFSTRSAEQIVEWYNNLTKNREVMFNMKKIPDDILFWNERSIVGVTNKKLPAVAYIDDRAILFTNWDDIVKKVLEIKE